MLKIASWTRPIWRAAATFGINSTNSTRAGVLLARHQPDEPAEAKPGLESVGGGERCTKQCQEAVEEAVVLDEIARHHRIWDGSGEKLLDEAIPHGLRPARLARSAQGFGEAFRHDVGSDRRFDHQNSGSMTPRGLRRCGKTGRELESHRTLGQYPM